MNFIIEDELKDIMKNRNQKHILVTSMLSHGWGRSQLAVTARFIDDAEVQVLKDDHFLSFPNDAGEILIRRIPQNTDENVYLGYCSSFDRISVKGIYSA